MAEPGSQCFRILWTWDSFLACSRPLSWWCILKDPFVVAVQEGMRDLVLTLLCVSVTPLPLHFPDVRGTESLCTLFGWVDPTAFPSVLGRGLAVRSTPSCSLCMGIECLSQSRGLHCYSAGRIPDIFRAFSSGHGMKRPFQACQKIISLYRRGCGTERC